MPTAPPGQSLDDYLSDAVKGDVPLNAAGLYVVFHLSALRYAAAYAETFRAGALGAGLRSGSEVFALHFLEDSFSSGHTVGTWGGAGDDEGHARRVLDSTVFLHVLGPANRIHHTGMPT